MSAAPAPVPAVCSICRANFAEPASAPPACRPCADFLLETVWPEAPKVSEKAEDRAAVTR